MKIRPVGGMGGLSHSEGQTDKHDEANNFCNSRFPQFREKRLLPKPIAAA